MITQCFGRVKTFIFSRNQQKKAPHCATRLFFVLIHAHEIPLGGPQAPQNALLWAGSFCSCSLWLPINT